MSVAVSTRASAWLFLVFAALLPACGNPPEESSTAQLPELVTPATPLSPSSSLSPAEFAGLIERLSEPGGFFPSDNLISNETAYLQVLGTLTKLGVRGGAYVGVGPDQNFSYIAHIRPAVAFIIDIRRDNLLQHFLFKALFENARNRLEYLCLMLGIPAPRDLQRWNDTTIDEIVLYLDRTNPTVAAFEVADRRLQESIQRFGYAVTQAELAKIQSIHATFFEFGLDIRYSSRGRSSRFPTWRNLMLQTDLEGNRESYLAREESFAYVQDLQRRNLIIPVVGDLSGPHALGAIGREIAARGLTLSAFYVSNVEQYLMRGPEFESFAATVAKLPHDRRSMIIRSYFPRGGQRFPRGPYAQIPGAPTYWGSNDRVSFQLLERFDTFIREYKTGGYRDYSELVSKNVLPLTSAPERAVNE